LAAAGGRPAYAVLPAPRLTVLLVLEELRADCLPEVHDVLTGNGLRRLLDHGAYYPGCRHLASSFTSSAAATLATGAWPSLHGIVADRWYERSARRAVPASDEALLATTLAAQVAAAPRTRVFVAGMDQMPVRIFAATPDAKLFWIDERGQIVTRGETPDWLAAYNRQKPLENLHDAPWMAAGARPGAPPLRTLVYDAAHPDDFVALYKASPFAQMAQFEFLSELVVREKLGQGTTTDLVCMLVGSTARLGYETGARSPLMRQMVLQLDRHVAFLLEQLGRAVGEDGFNVVLTAAHGAPPAPPMEARRRMAVNGEALAEALQRVLGGAPRVEKYLYPFLYLDSGNQRDPEPARLVAARAALAQAAVAATYTAGGASSIAGDWTARFRNSFHPQRSGDVMLAYRPEYVEDFGAGRGVSYGSLYNYDTAVPLCFYGPQFQAATFEQAVESVDVAPTLARVLGVGSPSSATGVVLGESFAKNVRLKK
jgi:hypothetical protein